MVNQADTPGASALRERVRRFLATSRSREFQTVARHLRELAGNSTELWCFGGVPRDLLAYSPPQTPRDIDIVVGSDSIESLCAAIPERVRRRTRFGGLQLVLGQWHVDVWPLSQTWAFREGIVPGSTFDDLPKTTFLNVEAIAVELWATERGRGRRVVESGFFEALRSRTMDINLEPNPFPGLCVVRSIIHATQLQFSLSARLVGYLARHMDALTSDDLLEIQMAHYGRVRIAADGLERWRRQLQEHDAQAAVLKPWKLNSVQQALFPDL